MENISCRKVRHSKHQRCRKIPKIIPGLYIFQWPLLRGLFFEALIYGGKFTFQNRLGPRYLRIWLSCSAQAYGLDGRPPGARGDDAERPPLYPETRDRSRGMAGDQHHRSPFEQVERH